MKKIIALLLISALLCMNLATVALADDGIAPYSSNFFSSYGASLSKAGSGKIKISFTATGTDTCDKLGVASYEVERLDSSGNWEDVSGTLNGSTKSDVVTYSFSKYFNGVSGETYRVKATFTCIIDGDGETKNYTSGRITAS